MARRDDARGISEALAVLVSAVVGIVVAVASVWYVSVPADSSFETLYRVDPSVEGGGVGADFVAGNTDPLYGALITFIHAVDVIMGLFILLMVFVHWGAFRRLAARMREPGEPPGDVAADGGRVDGRQHGDGGRVDGRQRGDGAVDGRQRGDGAADDGGETP